jgi:hypothetical protein
LKKRVQKRLLERKERGKYSLGYKEGGGLDGLWVFKKHKDPFKEPTIKGI